MEEIPELKEKLRIVVFAGGYGTRMWPMSRRSYAKQFQPLLGEKSFFREAIERVMIGFSPKDIFVSVPQEQVHYVKEQAPEIPPKNIIAEPERRDTLGAVGYATSFIDYHFPNSLMAVIWGADHLVKNRERFNRLFKVAGQVCQVENVICGIDAKPTYPSTAYGWVKVGKLFAKVEGYSVFEFERFIEKPPLDEAEKMFKNDSYYINTGYFVWRSSVMLNLYKQHAPECFSHLEKIRKSMGTGEEKEILKKAYSKIEKISVDYGLFEKLDKGHFVVIPADIGWYDVGTWDLLYEALAVGQRQNVSKGEVEYLDAQGNLVYIPKKKIAAVIGIEGLIVIDTVDGLLICKRGRGGDVKKFVEFLKEKGRLEYL